ncbi:MAG: hypothetical protein AB1806_09185 [Acidobacteriota bacterium]
MLSLLVRMQTLGWRLKDRLRNERGQTSSEYLVIAGVIVAIIITILGIFRTEVTDGMTKFAKKVKDVLQ